MVDLTTFVEGVVAVVVLGVGVFLVPWLKMNLSEKQMKSLMMWTDIAVNSAEMMYRGLDGGADKRAYVEDFLKAKGYKLDTEEIEAVIESSVLKLQGK